MSEVNTGKKTLADKIYDKLFSDGGFTGIDSAALYQMRMGHVLDFDYDDGNGMKSYSLILLEESE